MRYAASRHDDLGAKLKYFMNNIPDTIFDRAQFNEDAQMDRPNLSFILKGMDQSWAEPEEREELPQQEVISGLLPPPPKEGGMGPGIFVFAGSVLAAFLFFGRR